MAFGMTMAVSLATDSVTSRRLSCLFFCICLAVVFAPSNAVGAKLLARGHAPLHTQGRFIVDRLGERVKWACVNYYGAETKSFTPGGLDEQPIETIAARIVEMGFNCIRFPYSIQQHIENPVVQDQFVSANPRFRGMRSMEVYDATITALTAAGLMIVIDNHVSKAGWCCVMQQENGLWYTPDYSADVWIESLYNITLRYLNNPMVVGIGLRNEVHDYFGTKLTWGDGNPDTDWAAAATMAGNRVLQANPNILVVVMALCSGMCLIPAREHPIVLAVPNRVVYEVHNYMEYVFTNLIPHDLISWDGLHFHIHIIIVVLLALLALLLFDWSKLGQPTPPPGVWMQSFSWWVLGFGCIAVIAVIAALWKVDQFCHWWAHNVVVNWFWWPLGVVAIGVIMNFLGKYIVQVSADDGDANKDWANICRSAGGATSPRALVPTNDDCTPISPNSILSPGQPVLNFHLGTKLHVFTGCTSLLLLAYLLDNVVNYISTYEWTKVFLDDKWGFALEEGQPFTAPVWMGEFGYANQGEFWMNFVTYLSERDIDFGYWAFNGKKYGEGFIQPRTGDFYFWAACFVGPRALPGTNCLDELGGGPGSWAGDTLGGACVVHAPTQGISCHSFCNSHGRNCVKGQTSSGGVCKVDQTAVNLPENGCLEVLPDPVCVCTKRYWVWDNETFGLMDRDFNTVKSTWRVRDLQAIAESPARWRPGDIGCVRDVHNYVCDEGRYSGTGEQHAFSLFPMLCGTALHLVLWFV